MSAPIQLSRRDDFQIFRGSLAGESACLGADPLSQADETGIYVCFGPRSGGGRVLIETAPSVGYAGEWALLADIAWIASGRAHYVGLTGAYLALRVRIAEEIVGDDVAAYATGN